MPKRFLQEKLENILVSEFALLAQKWWNGLKLPCRKRRLLSLCNPSFRDPTFDAWHVTHDTGHRTHDLWHLICFDFWFDFICATILTRRDIQCVMYVRIFKASALWADAFYKSKCPSVRLCVCSLLRYRLTVFLPQFPEVGCPIFLEIRNPWGKVIERSGLRYECLCLKIG